MAFNIKVYCNNCHRESQSQLRQHLTREEIESTGKCWHCDVRGKLRLISAR